MTYQVLARRLRPKRFEEVVGQEHVTRTLQAAIAAGRVAHAFLFAGPRGVGKTTTARLLAKALNCERGVGQEPCNECTNCREIGEGRAFDVLEIDRSEEHTSELQSRTLISYAVFCLKKIKSGRNAFPSLSCSASKRPCPQLSSTFLTVARSTPRRSVFFFNDAATTEIYTSVHTLSLHDALPISWDLRTFRRIRSQPRAAAARRRSEEHTSELQSRTLISYAVFCLKKKNTLMMRTLPTCLRTAPVTTVLSIFVMMSITCASKDGGSFALIMIFFF